MSGHLLAATRLLCVSPDHEAPITPDVLYSTRLRVLGLSRDDRLTEHTPE